PRSVAVIGVSRRTGTIGRAFFEDIVDAGFTGPVHAVNNRAEPGTEIYGHRTLRSVREIEGGVDLAVIAVPAADVLETLEECADAGVRAVVVPSEGFAEVGPEGAALQHQLLLSARRFGMRVLGPNSFGL